jgi:hypothetical protein
MAKKNEIIVKDVAIKTMSKDGIVTMFADANERNRNIKHHSRGLRAPCREAPPRCFS